MNKFFLLIVLSLFCLTAPVQAQDFSNKGKDFWLCFPGHVDGNNAKLVLYITSNYPTSGTVSYTGGSINFNVAANGTTPISTIPTASVINAQREGIGVGKGIHIVSQNDIMVYAAIFKAAGGGIISSIGSSVLLPTNTLGKDYIVSSFKSDVQGNFGSFVENNGTNQSQTGSEFNVVATKDSTLLVITPTFLDVDGNQAVGAPFSPPLLNKGDVYQYRTTATGDITGTRIKSVSYNGSPCKPIAVFSGSTWTTLNCNSASSGDNLFLQAMPLNTWGKNFVAVPFAGRDSSIYRIILSDTSTIVKVNNVTQLTGMLGSGTGKYYQFTTSTPFSLSSDKPVLMVQYMKTELCDRRNDPTPLFPGDPEMIIVSPIEQTINDVTVVSLRKDLELSFTTTIETHYLTVITKSNATASVRIDGAVPAATFQSIGTTGYSYVIVDVTQSTKTNAAHRIVSDSGFIAFAHGLGNQNSYGYNAGTNVRDLYQFLTIQNDSVRMDRSTTCDSTVFSLYLTLPYNAPLNSITVDCAGLQVPTNITFDGSYTKDARTLYRYKLVSNQMITTPGTYPIKISAQNPSSDGCAGLQEMDYEIKVLNRPKTAFSISSAGCGSKVTTFIDQSIIDQEQSIAKYVWDFGDGINATVANSNTTLHTYAANGPFTTLHQVISDIGCKSNVATKTLSFGLPPTAGYDILSPTCSRRVINFKDTSNGNGQQIVKWTWDFGDGVTSTIQNPTHTYSTKGDFPVRLTVETADGCVSSATQRYITIFETPKANFTFSAAGCSKTVSFQSTSTGTVQTTIWDFGDFSPTGTSPNPTHTYSNVGTYTVKLVAQNDACPDTAVQTIKITGGPTVNFDLNYASGVCVGDQIIATDKTITASGDRVVSWTWTDGGTGNQGGIRTDSIMKVSYPNPGTYKITLYIKTQNGCIDSISKYVDVNNNPTIKIIAVDSVCINTMVHFTSQAPATGGNSYTWVTANGNIDHNTDYDYFFTAPGRYLTTLQVQTASGCKSKIDSVYTTVLAAPTASFSFTPVCVGKDTVQFINLTTVIPGIKYLWEYFDGSNQKDTSRNPSHVFPTGWAGVNVKLTTYTSYGCTDDTSIVINPIPRPIAYIMPDYTSVCLGSPFSIRSLNNNNFTSWYVNYGDGTDTTVTSLATGNYLPSKTYKNPGTYRVSLIVKNASGCSSLPDTVILTIPPTEKAVISVNKKTCVGQSVRLYDSSNVYDNYQTIWNYGDGKIDTILIGKNQPQLHTYNSPGIYYPTLQLLLNNGCLSTIAKDTIVVGALPVASFVPGIACAGSPVKFTNQSVGATSYIWNFGDGSTDTITSPLHSFLTGGPWNIKLTAINTFGCTKDTNIVIAPSPIPVAYVRGIPTATCVGAPVTFKDSSVIALGTINSWYINYGDGTDTTVIILNGGFLPYKVYNSPGVYIVKFQVTSSTGCKSLADSITITINPTFNASIGVSKKTGCKGDAFSLTDRTNYTQGTITKWYWSFGDGTIDTVSQRNVNHSYTSAGTYIVTLQLQAEGVCKSAIAKDTIVIQPNPTVIFTADTVCVGENVSFKNSSTGASSYVWDFGDLTTSTAVNPSHPYTAPGIKAVKLLANSLQGCKDSATKNIVVNGAPTSSFTITSTGQCASDLVTIQDGSSVSTAGSVKKVEIYWDITSASSTEYTLDVNPSTGKTYSHTYPGFTTPASKTFRIKYIVYSGTSCVDSSFKDITLYSAPILTFLPVNEVCDNVTPFSLSVSVAGGIAGIGTYSGTGVSTSGIFNPIVAGAGSHTITYNFTSSNGCTSKATQVVVVNPTPVANAGPDKVLLDGNSVILTPILITSIPVTYLWSPATYLDDVSKANATVTGLIANTVYTLLVTSDKGCSSTDMVLVKYVAGIMVPNIFSPNGDGIHDYWDIEALRDYPNVLVQVFNRYGQLVYRSEGYSIPWDGKISGRPAPVGTYYYIIDLRNGKKPLNGYVDIIR